MRFRSTPWRSASFAVLDFETTGLDLRRDHVVSYGLVPIERGRILVRDSLYAIVRPPVAMSSESIRVHGIRPSEIANAPVLTDVVGRLVDALDGRVLVAHAAGIELGFLERICHDAGLPRVRWALDVLVLASEVVARFRLEPLSSPRLAYVAERFGVPAGRTHHAFHDALTTAQLFLVLATRLEQLGEATVRDLRRIDSSQFARTFSTGPP